MNKKQIDTPEINNLVDKISRLIEEGKIKIKTAIEKEKTTSYWTIGSLIHEYIDSTTHKSTYGQYVFSTLAERLHIGKKTLYLTVQFYTTYPDFDLIENSRFTWSHFKILITIKTEEKRKVYEKILNESNLSIKEFGALVRGDKLLPTSRGTTLTLYPGIPYLYRFVQKNDTFLLDLGFHTYIDYFHDQLELFDKDAHVRVRKNDTTYTLQQKVHDDFNLYTYKAYVSKIIDGDTIKVDIDLGFHITTNQTLRLRGINAFEIQTRKGRRAKKFVVDALNNCRIIVIKTYHRDKFSRFLADVFYSDSDTDITTTIENGRFLNQELLDEQLAVKYYRY